MADQDFGCEAYGPGNREYGALCFFARPGERLCWSPQVCHNAMTAERHRIFGRIQERAAAGDPTAVMLAEHFTSPDQLLGGREA